MYGSLHDGRFADQILKSGLWAKWFLMDITVDNGTCIQNCFYCLKREDSTINIPVDCHRDKVAQVFIPTNCNKKRLK